MRSLLFVPGDHPKKLAKGLTSGADIVIVDLEDSVGPDRKPAARANAAAFLKENSTLKQRPLFYVRVNALDTETIDDDLDAVVAAKPDGIMLPKAMGGAALMHLDAKITARETLHGVHDNATKVIVIATETAAALFLAGTYGGASKRLNGLTWGAEDLSTDLGAESNRNENGDFLDPYRLARSLCLAGAASAGVAAIDTVFVDFRDQDGLRREAEGARRDGFTAKMAIHPAQVAIINEVFTPSADAIAKARRVIDAFAAQPGAGVIAIDGVMFDRPHVVRAQALLARARAAGSL